MFLLFLALHFFFGRTIFFSATSFDEYELAIWKDEESGTIISHRRSGIPGSPFAEYDRILIVKSRDLEPKVFDLPQDTGGYQRINLFRDHNGKIFLQECSAFYEIEKSSLNVLFFLEWDKLEEFSLPLLMS